MTVGMEPQKCIQRSLRCDGCDSTILPGEMMLPSGSRWVHAEESCEAAGAAPRDVRVWVPGGFYPVTDLTCGRKMTVMSDF